MFSDTSHVTGCPDSSAVNIPDQHRIFLCVLVPDTAYICLVFLMVCGSSIADT